MTKLFRSSSQAGLLQLQRTNVCIININPSSEHTPLFKSANLYIEPHEYTNSY